MSVYVIAEAGVNHNGSREIAFQLVDAAVASGADAVKFQTYKTEHLTTRDAIKADYQIQATGLEGSQFSMLKQLELTEELHRDLMSYCNDIGIQFLSTAFDSPSLNFLVNDLALKKLKISSGEITNGPFLLENAQTGCDLILSTGMATLGEIEEALGVIAYGFLKNSELIGPPSRSAFEKAYLSKEGQLFLKEKVTLLHCTTKYPAHVDEINLRAMNTIRTSFGLATGYSDHSIGIEIPIAAAALGAAVIEKHFTMDRSMPGPDHKASLEPNELEMMILAIRKVEVALGDGLKRPMPSEIGNREFSRKSLVATQAIKKGDVFSEENLGVKRPGTGRSPMKYWDTLGKLAHFDIVNDGVIS